MEMSVREARAQFAHALAAAERGERVTITKNGKPVAEIGPPVALRNNPFTWEKAAEVRKQLGGTPAIGNFDEKWREEFDDKSFGLEALGLDEDWEPLKR